MDRRRLMSRSSSLHKVLSESQSSTRSQDAAASGSLRRSGRGSQKLSNSEMLRRKMKAKAKSVDDDSDESNGPVRSPSKDPKPLTQKSSPDRRRLCSALASDDDSNEASIASKNVEPKTSLRRRSKRNISALDTTENKPASSSSKQPNETTYSPLKALKTSTQKSTPDKKERPGSELSSDDDSNKVTAIRKKLETKTPLATQNKRRISELDSPEKEPAASSKKPPEEKLLVKRKKFQSQLIDSDSEEELVEKSPLKVRRVDNRLGKQNVEVARTSKNSSSQRTTNLRLSQNRPSLSDNSSLSLRISSSQRESNSARLMKLVSPVKAPEVQPDESDEFISPTKRKKQDKLEDFLRRSGITLSEDDEHYQLDDDPPIVAKKMVDLLSSGVFKKQEIIDLWCVYINSEENLKKALNDFSFTNPMQPGRTGSNVSLVRMFLQIPEFQTAVSNHMLQKLNEAVLIANSIDDVPWAPLLLQQFRFLETIVDTDSLKMRLEELLETCPIWFQQELILFLPDIVIDVQHHAISEMLVKLMESQADLTSVILECIANLTVGKEHLEVLREKVLNMLKSNLHVGRVPAMAKFALNECPSIKVCQKVLSVLRSLELQPLSGQKGDEYFTNQSFLISSLKMSILLSRDMSGASMAVVKNTEQRPKPLDLIMLLLVYSDATKKKNAETVLKQHVKSGFYRPSLLNSLYQDYKEVAKDLQSEALQLASNLLKSEDSAYTEFAIEWFRNQFVSQSDTIYKQREVIEKIILLMGNNNSTVKGALGVLQRLTENEKERKLLHAHCNHLRILLEKIDNIDLQDVATLNDLLYALCTSSNSANDALQDDLFILLQKQLSNAKALTKCKGVLGAAMAIKHLAKNPESCKTAEEFFAKVEVGTKNCPRSQALFYDQIGRVIANTDNIDTDFLKNITDRFQDEFVNTYMTDLDDYKGDLAVKFGLVDSETEPQKCVINFRDGKYGCVAPAFFRLLRICFMRLHDGSLADINLLLGVPVLMPNDMELPEAWSLDLMICCINWFRELISGFVTQSEDILQEQLVKRLENLMTLQATFSSTLALSDTRYQPPPCYFHRFPAPNFVKVEKKIVKKGGKRGNADKSNSFSESESWETGSTLCKKNPMYFRQMDAKVVELLDLRMNEESSQAPEKVSKAQVCFLIKELSTMLEDGNASETLMRDLIYLLPKICSKLQEVVAELREEDNAKNRQATKLILSLLAAIFEWKGFQSAAYHSLLRDGLRTLAGQIEKSNSMLRSSKELVAESYKYFESLADIATEISLAYALVKMCRVLMKHSDTFAREFKNKQAKMAYGFLSLKWPDDRPADPAYKAAVVGLLANWMQYEPDLLETVTTVLQWLPEEVEELKKTQDRLGRLPTITKANFHHMFQRLFQGLINGAKISFSEATSDQGRIEVWHKVGNNLKKIIQICKSSSRAVLQPFLRCMTSLLKVFMQSGLPVMEHNLRYQPEEVKDIVKMIQGGIRYMNMVCVDCTEKKDIALTRLVPMAKQVCEKFVYMVKGMLVLNNSLDAFWMGNLRNKNLEGQQILSQTSEDVTSTTSNASVAENSDDDAMSEILDSELEDKDSDDE